MKILVQNKKASFNYFLEKSFECGLVLKGTEVKSLAKSQATLDQAYVLIKNREVFILGMHIAPYDHGNIHNVDPLRTRKLLLKKNEIIRLITLTKTQNYLLIPKKVYFARNKIKIEVCLAKPKKLHDKRESIKAKDLKRKIEKLY